MMELFTDQIDIISNKIDNFTPYRFESNYL
jgi:hypothetical protein